MRYDEKTFIQEVKDRGYATKAAARRYVESDKKIYYTENDLYKVYDIYWSIRTKRMDQARRNAEQKLRLLEQEE